LAHPVKVTLLASTFTAWLTGGLDDLSWLGKIGRIGWFRQAYVGGWHVHNITLSNPRWML